MSSIRYHIKCPFHTRYQLLNNLVGRYPAEASKYKKMSKKQLYAIWYSIQRKNHY